MREAFIVSIACTPVGEAYRRLVELL